jgi:hypothetical protein
MLQHGIMEQDQVGSRAYFTRGRLFAREEDLHLLDTIAKPKLPGNRGFNMLVIHSDCANRMTLTLTSETLSAMDHSNF